MLPCRAAAAALALLQRVSQPVPLITRNAIKYFNQWKVAEHQGPCVNEKEEKCAAQGVEPTGEEMDRWEDGSHQFM